jgi:tripartite-type tricarboxylate transporter receptor subunit TctC
VFANERLKAMPDVPTFKERGYDVFPYGPLVQMAYIVAPAKTPEPVQQRLVEIFSKAIQSPEFRKSAEQGGAVVDNVTGAALGKEIDSVQKSLNEVGKKVFVAEKK